MAGVSSDDGRPGKKSRPPDDLGPPQQWGIVGLGAQAEAVARALPSVPGVVLAGCASGDRARADAFAREFGCRAHASDAELAAAGYDVVVVASANAHHAAQAADALAGGSAVLCEKPMTLSVADARQLLGVAAGAGQPLYVGYHLRFQALTAELRAIVQAGELGHLRDISMQRYSEQVTSRVRSWRHDLTQAGAGVLCDVGVHLFDAIGWVTGLVPVAVGATAAPPRRTGRPDEHVVVALEMDNGSLAVVDAARSIPVGENDLHLHGTAGSLCTGPLRWTADFHAELQLADGTRRRVRADANQPLVEELRAVRDGRRGRPTGSLATGADGLRGVAVLEAAVQSLDEGRRVEVDLGAAPSPDPA